jgi:hypothetical protein
LCSKCFSLGNYDNSNFQLIYLSNHFKIYVQYFFCNTNLLMNPNLISAKDAIHLFLKIHRTDLDQNHNDPVCIKVDFTLFTISQRTFRSPRYWPNAHPAVFAKVASMKWWSHLAIVVAVWDTYTWSACENGYSTRKLVFVKFVDNRTNLKGWNIPFQSCWENFLLIFIWVTFYDIFYNLEFFRRFCTSILVRCVQLVMYHTSDDVFYSSHFQLVNVLNAVNLQNDDPRPSIIFFPSFIFLLGKYESFLFNYCQN